MNSKLLTTATLAAAVASTLLLSLPARAQEATPDYPQAYSSTLSRAEVRASAIRARAAGLIVDGERSAVSPGIGMPAGRAQVQGELREARRLGLLADGEQTAVASDAQLAAIHNAGLRAGASTVAGTR
jgi:predicted secreted protein